MCKSVFQQFVVAKQIALDNLPRDKNSLLPPPTSQSLAICLKKFDRILHEGRKLIHLLKNNDLGHNYKNVIRKNVFD